jgi:hypothetical protein
MTQEMKGKKVSFLSWNSLTKRYSELDSSSEEVKSASWPSKNNYSNYQS